MAPIRSIVQRATDATAEPAVQMQMIRRIVEDIYGGSWGVVIIRNPALVSRVERGINSGVPGWSTSIHGNAPCIPVYAPKVTYLAQSEYIEVHWTIPDHNNADGTPAFCLTVVKGWQYNIFKTGSRDIRDRVTVESIVRRLRLSDEKRRPARMTVQEFDRMLEKAIRAGENH